MMSLLVVFMVGGPLSWPPQVGGVDGFTVDAGCDESVSDWSAIGDTARVDVHATLDAPCSAEQLFAYVDDLERYPMWMDLLHRVEPSGTGDPAWHVELRARVGPFARSKRLRMRRTVLDATEHRVVFERAEADGRTHSPWVLRAEVLEHDGVSTLHMHLHYGGALWTAGVLERVLADQITDGRERLTELVSSRH
jgi:hypothetical protein